MLWGTSIDNRRGEISTPAPTPGLSKGLKGFQCLVLSLTVLCLQVLQRRWDYITGTTVTPPSYRRRRSVGDGWLIQGVT